MYLDLCTKVYEQVAQVFEQGLMASLVKRRAMLYGQLKESNALTNIIIMIRIIFPYIMCIFDIHMYKIIYNNRWDHLRENDHT